MDLRRSECLSPRSVLFLFFSSLLAAACSSQKPDLPDDARAKLGEPAKELSVQGLASGEVEPPTPEEAAELLEQKGGDWFYGQGLGGTMLNIGACIIFPPYALYLLTNIGLQAAGYEPLYVTDALPDGPREGVTEVYREVTSVPGRVTSTVAGEEFREK